MKSGILAAESAWEALSAAESESEPILLESYPEAIKNSSIHAELKEVRNMRPSFHTPLGLYGGVLYSGIEAFIFKGKVPWTLHHPEPDYAATKPASECKKIEYPKPDGKISFDILTSVSRTGTNHEEDQPVHLQVPDWGAHEAKEWPKYQGLEARFCPAGVYEYVEDESREHGVRFHIVSSTSQSEMHCLILMLTHPGRYRTHRTVYIVKPAISRRRRRILIGRHHRVEKDPNIL